MDWDDEFDEEYDDALEYEDSEYESSDSPDLLDETDRKDDLDFLDISDPKSAYFFLSDDVQDELDAGRKRMKCILCGHKFMGEIFDSCPKCFSSATEEINSGYENE